LRRRAKPSLGHSKSAASITHLSLLSKLRGNTKRIVDTDLKFNLLPGGGELWRTTRVWTLLKSGWIESRYAWGCRVEHLRIAEDILTRANRNEFRANCLEISKLVGWIDRHSRHAFPANQHFIGVELETFHSTAV
jgi:hypothetical protein